MARSQDLEVQEKKELVSKEEKTMPSRYYMPNTDIYETDDALTVVMEIPGVQKKDMDIHIENDVLRVASISAITRVWSRYTPSTTSGISRGRSRYPARSISSK